MARSTALAHLPAATAVLALATALLITTPAVAQEYPQLDGELATFTITAADGDDPVVLDDGGADGIVGNEVQPGDVVTMTLGGYAPGARIEIWMHSEPVLLAVVFADSRGEVDIEAAIPADAAVGAHDLRISGEGADGTMLTVEQPIEVPDPQVVEAHEIALAAAETAGAAPDAEAGARTPVLVALVAAVALAAVLLGRTAIRR